MGSASVLSGEASVGTIYAPLSGKDVPSGRLRNAYGRGIIVAEMIETSRVDNEAALGAGAAKEAACSVLASVSMATAFGEPIVGRACVRLDNQPNTA